MNILLLNLTRFGDLIQSQAAVNDLTAQGHKVAMVCLGNFAEAGGLIHGLSHVFPFRGAALLKTFDDTGLSAEKTWHHALADLAAWREELREEFKPDLICNLTPSLPARMLSFFLSKNAAQSGFALDERGFGINANAWAAFLQGAAISRGVSPFNIVDVFRMMAADVEYEPHVSPLPGNSSLLLPSEESRKRVASFLDNHAPSGHKGFIAFQLGASESRRRWPVT